MKSMTDKIRFGIIGVGGQGNNYAGFLSGKDNPDMPHATLNLKHCALGGISIQP